MMYILSKKTRSVSCKKIYGWWIWILVTWIYTISYKDYNYIKKQEESYTCLSILLVMIYMVLIHSIYIWSLETSYGFSTKLILLFVERSVQNNYLMCMKMQFNYKYTTRSHQTPYTTIRVNALFCTIQIKVPNNILHISVLVIFSLNYVLLKF